MAVSDDTEKYHEKMLPGDEPDFFRTDPEFIERFDHFAFDEVIWKKAAGFDDKMRFLVVLSALLGCQGIEKYEKMAPAALNFEVTPIEISGNIALVIVRSYMQASAFEGSKRFRR